MKTTFSEEAKKLLGDNTIENAQEWKVLWSKVDVKILELELQVQQLKQQALQKEVNQNRWNKLTNREDCTEDCNHYNNGSRPNQKTRNPIKKKRRLVPSRFSPRLSDELPELKRIKYVPEY
jgi:hypothetical protein